MEVNIKNAFKLAVKCSLNCRACEAFYRILSNKTTCLANKFLWWLLKNPLLGTLVISVSLLLILIILLLWLFIFMGVIYSVAAIIVLEGIIIFTATSIMTFAFLTLTVLLMHGISLVVVLENKYQRTV